jgi:hypothetical protein
MTSETSKRRKLEAQPAREKYYWRDAGVEKLYLDLWIAGIAAGSRSTEGTFKPVFWRDVGARIAACGYPEPTLDQMNSKRASWAKRWKVFARLETLSGWGFDEMSGMLTAPEACWAEEIRKDPEVAWHRNNSLRYISELREVFDKVHATGHYAQGGTAIASTANLESTDADEDVDNEVVLLTPAPVLKRPTPVPKRKIDSAMDVLVEVSKALHRLQGEDIIGRAVEVLHSEFEAALSPENFIRAVDIVEKHANTFVALKSDTRRWWLNWKLNPGDTIDCSNA